jgi:hypothetical protein
VRKVVVVRVARGSNKWADLEIVRNVIASGMEKICMLEMEVPGNWFAIQGQRRYGYQTTL